MELTDFKVTTSATSLTTEALCAAYILTVLGRITVSGKCPSECRTFLHSQSRVKQPIHRHRLPPLASESSATVTGFYLHCVLGVVHTDFLCSLFSVFELTKTPA